MIKILHSFIHALCLTAFLWLVNTGFVSAQGTSNKGTDFWVAYTGHLDGTKSMLTLFVTSQYNTTVTVDAGGTTLAPVTVTANQAVPIYIDPGIYTNTYIPGSDAAPAKKGIHVTSTQPIVLYSHISHSARSAATLVLPTKALGNEYYAISYIQKSKSGYSQFTLVGVEDSTVVEITPTVASINSTRMADQTFSVRLNKGEVYQYQSDTDVTGSKIRTVGSCKPIAVFSGSSFANFCEPGNTRNPEPGTGDNLYQQLFPVSSWGKLFITAPFYNAQNGAADIIRVQVLSNDTAVKINGASNIYQAGETITFSSASPSRIDADKPISVAQFQVTEKCNFNNPNGVSAPFPGDPEMTILNPIEQTLTDITLYSAVSTAAAPTNIKNHYINIILKTADISSLKVDGGAPSGIFTAIDSEYSYITVDVTISSASNPSHRIVCNNGFIAIAYGYGNVESYAYLAGADIKNLNANIQIYEPGSVTAKSLLCSGKDYEVTLQLPYKTGKIIWNLNNGAKIDTVTAPVPATSTGNGLPAYFYKYTLAASNLMVPGPYSLKATVINPAPTSCSADEDVSAGFEVLPVPSVSFSADRQQACIASPVTFTDKSNPNLATITKWYWDFGDKTTETRTTGDPFQHIYSASGDYQVTLVVESEAGCRSSPVAPLIIHINKTPDASFTFPALSCETRPVQFTDKSVANEGQVMKWNWDFGDGQLSAEQNPSHTFSASGKYRVKLTVETDKGCLSSVFSAEITVNPLPQVDFDVPDFCLADGAALFTNKTTVSDGSQLTYLWDFGDPYATPQRPNTSALQNASHRYTRAGRYTIKLTVKSAAGCEVTLPKPFVVNGGVPKADFTVKNSGLLCSDKPVEFEDRVIVALDEEVTKIEWIYDFVNNPNTIGRTDDSPAVRASPTRIYSYKYPTFTSPASKTYQVKMIAYTGGSCMHEISKYITVLAVPAVDFELPPACLTNGTANFKDKSVIAGTNGPFTYLWDFGDKNATPQKPNTSADKDPQHTYSEAGDYIVTLTVTSQAGCSTTLSKTLTVAGSIPKAAFAVLNPDKLCSDGQVVFEDRTTVNFGEITKIDWYYDYGNNPSLKFTDDSTAKRGAPLKQYAYTYPVFYAPATKSVTVRMVAYSGAVCMDDDIQTITLHAVPQVQFDSIPDICSDSGPVQLTQAKEIHGVLPGKGTYTGRGVTSAGLFDQATAGIGSHTLTYTFIADNGCTDFKTQTVTVNQVPSITIGPDLFVLEGGRIKLPALAMGSNPTYKWTPSTYLDHDDILNPVTMPADDITYVLTVTTDKGCTATGKIFVKVLKSPEVPNTFTPNGDGVNDTWRIKYLESYPDATVEVFNRYGEKLFQSVNYHTEWDGKKNGTDLPVGTYYYIINPKNGRKIISGSVTVLR